MRIAGTTRDSARSPRQTEGAVQLRARTILPLRMSATPATRIGETRVTRDSARSLRRTRIIRPRRTSVTTTRTRATRVTFVCVRVIHRETTPVAATRTGRTRTRAALTRAVRRASRARWRLRRDSRARLVRARRNSSNIARRRLRRKIIGARDGEVVNERTLVEPASVPALPISDKHFFEETLPHRRCHPGWPALFAGRRTYAVPGR